MLAQAEFIRYVSLFIVGHGGFAVKFAYQRECYLPILLYSPKAVIGTSRVHYQTFAGAFRS